MRRALAALLVVLTPGCLASSYVIPREDALALTQLPPERRGDAVRVVQEIFADEPERAPRVDGSTQLDVTPRVFVSGGWSTSGGTVGVTPPGGVAGGVGAPAGGGGTVGVTPPAGAGTVAVTPAPGGAAPTNPSGGGGGGGGGGGDGAAVLVVVVVALSAVVALVAAGTEGARYDGWARLHPMHPVHVVGPDGSVSWVPLAQLDPAMASWASELIVSEDEGPFERLGRAPLNRVGFVYGMEMGGATARGRRGVAGLGFASHVQLGFFPLQQLGLLVDLMLGLGDDRGNTLVNVQVGGEVQVLPINLDPVQLGVFGRLGSASPSQRDDRWALAGGGGALVQLALTTRLALTLRGGVSYVADARGGVLAGEGTLGVAVY